MKRPNILRQNFYLKLALLPLALVFTTLLFRLTTCPAKIQNQNDFQFNYPKDLTKLRKTAFKHIKNTSYLDYTGAGVYMDQAIKEYQQDLLNHYYTEEEKTNEMNQLRKEVLRFVDADPSVYECIFVQSATQALKLVGENFPWKKDSKYVFTRYNHNSVLGIRKYLINAGGSFAAIHSPKEVYDIPYSKKSYNLLAFPLEENFAGKKFPQEEVQNILQNKTLRENWFIFGDAAAFLPTNPLSLKTEDYDAICMSFYKIIGFPNTGALVIKKKFLDFLVKKTFLDHSVNFTSIHSNNFHLNSFEDDEPPFNLNLAVKYGLKYLNQIGMKNIQKHTAQLTERLYNGLHKMSHSNGIPAVKIYGNHEQGLNMQGAIVAFNVMRTAELSYGYFEFVKAASEAGFHLRGGCHCNPGACFENVGLEEQKVKIYFQAKTTCGDENDVVDDVPLGAVRASLGWASTAEDVDNFLKWVAQNYVF